MYIYQFKNLLKIYSNPQLRRFMMSEIKPFVTKKVGAGHMIQIGGENHDARWLTSGGKWTRDVFEAIFWPRRKAAERVLATVLAILG